MLLNVNQIKEIIPHRYPFLLVDEIIELERTKRIVGKKCVTANEPFFQGHFPAYPVMPGVLIIEALAQTGAVLMLYEESNRGKTAFFAGIDKAKFRKKVFPGDVLTLEVVMDKVRGAFGTAHAKAYVEDALACEAVLTFVVEG